MKTYKELKAAGAIVDTTVHTDPQGKEHLQIIIKKFDEYTGQRIANEVRMISKEEIEREKQEYEKLATDNNAEILKEFEEPAPSK